MTNNRIISIPMVEEDMLLNQIASTKTNQHATDRPQEVKAARERYVSQMRQSIRRQANLNQVRPQNQPPHAQWLKKAFNFLIKMCQVNLAGEDGFGPSVKRCDLPLWSKLVEIYLSYFAIKLIVIEIVQHKYSRLSFELDGFNQSSSGSANKHAKLDEDLRRADEWLDVLGSPWREVGYPVELVYVYDLAIVYLAYMGFKLFVHGKRPVRLGVLRFLLDEEKERINMDRDICKQLDEFLVSSENHLWVNHSEWFGKSMGPDSSLGPTREIIENKFQQELRSHQLLAREVLNLLLGAGLMPLNRTNRWLTNMQTLAGLLILLFETAGFTLCLLFFIVFPRFVIQVGLHYGTADLLFMVEALAYFWFGLQVVSLYLLLLVISSIDMIKYALELHQLIGCAIKLAHHIREHEPKQTFSIRQLNSSLITILVHFKMFREQLTGSKEIQGFGLSLAVIDMIAGPVLGRLVVTHLDLSSKGIAVPTMLLFILLADLIIVPACYLQARCLDIYRSLSSLMANLIAIERSSGNGTKASWSTSGLSFSQCLLQRELNVPEMMFTRFTTKTQFGQVTYSRFLAIHFWCGLLLISLWVSGNNSTGNVIADSLRLF